MANQGKLEIDYVGSLFGHNGAVTALTIGKDNEGKPLLVSGSRDKKLIVWRLYLDQAEELVDEQNKPTGKKCVGKPYKSLSGHSHFVSGVALSKDSKFVLSSSWDKTLRLWDLNTFKTRTLFTGHSKDILCCDFANEDRSIISGSMDNTLRVYNIKGEHKHTCQEFGGWVSCVSQIKQEKQNILAVGSQDKSVKLYDSDYRLLSSIDEFDYGVVSTASDADGEFLFSAEKNGKIKVHILSGSNAEFKSQIEINGDINAISFESNYFLAISVASSKGLQIVEVYRQSKPLFVSKNKTSCNCIAWDQSKKFLFAGFQDGSIDVYRFNMTGDSK